MPDWGFFAESARAGEIQDAATLNMHPPVLPWLVWLLPVIARHLWEQAEQRAWTHLHAPALPYEIATTAYDQMWTEMARVVLVPAFAVSRQQSGCPQVEAGPGALLKAVFLLVADLILLSRDNLLGRLYVRFVPTSGFT
jgi:hypothetical protein